MQSISNAEASPKRYSEERSPTLPKIACYLPRCRAERKDENKHDRPEGPDPQATPVRTQTRRRNDEVGANVCGQLKEIGPPDVIFHALRSGNVKDGGNRGHALIQAKRCFDLVSHPRPIPSIIQLDYLLVQLAKDVAPILAPSHRLWAAEQKNRQESQKGHHSGRASRNIAAIVAACIELLKVLLLSGTELATRTLVATLAVAVTA
eukprot:2157615-Prymnesium_polylepis.1